MLSIVMFILSLSLMPSAPCFQTLSVCFYYHGDIDNTNLSKLHCQPGYLRQLLGHTRAPKPILRRQSVRRPALITSI